MKTWKIEITATDEKSAMKFLKNLYDAFKVASNFGLPVDSIIGKDGEQSYTCINDDKTPRMETHINLKG